MQTSSSDSSNFASWILRSSSCFSSWVFRTSSSGFSFCMVMANSYNGQKTKNNYWHVQPIQSLNLSATCSDAPAVHSPLNINRLKCHYRIFTVAIRQFGIVQFSFFHSIINIQQTNMINKVSRHTWLVRPARVVVKLTSVMTDAASAGISGFGFLVVRNSRNSSL